MAEEVKEIAEETTEETVAPESKEEKSADWDNEANPYKAEAAKYKRMAEQRGRKLDKYAEAGKDEAEESKTQDKPQSTEPDYGRIAYLNSEGIHPDDHKIVLDEAKRLNLPLTEVRNMEHVKSRLQANKDQREAAVGGNVKGGKRAGGSTQHDVDYWLNKDGDERPSDPELARKVLQAKVAKEKSTSQFSDMMYS